MTDLTIRVGGKYRTRGGEEAEVTEAGSEDWDFKGVCISAEGRYPCAWLSSGRHIQHWATSFDLVSEITEPTAGERFKTMHPDECEQLREGVAGSFKHLNSAEMIATAAHPDQALAERIRSGCPDTVGDEFFAMTVEGAQASGMTKLDRYISTCRAISEDGKYQWWARLADLLEGLRGAKGSKGDE